MEDFIDSSYDENDIEDFEDYLQYYGFDESELYEDDIDIDDENYTAIDDDDDTYDSDIKELYF